MLLPLVLVPLALAQDGWSALPVPSLAQPAPAELLETGTVPGSHLELEPTRRRPSRPDTAFRLPLANLIELLEADARRSGAELRCLRTAPPLLARGSEAGLARARALVLELDRAGQSHTILLETRLTPAGEEPRQHAESVRSGEAVRVGESTTHPFLADFDVDVASGGGTADPVFGRAEVGEVVRLRAWRTPDGRGVFVRGSLDLAELAGIDQTNLDSPDLGRLDVPRVRSVVVFFSGLVESGSELEVAVSGAPLARPDWVLTVRASTEPDQPAAWRVADLAWLESPVPPLELPVPGAGLEVRETRDFAMRVLEPLSASILWGELEASFASRRAERPLFAVAPGVIVAPASDARVWDELDGLLAAAQRSRSVTHAVDVRADGLTVRFPTAEGIDFRVQAGEERTVLVDFDTEIAPEFWMPEPRVERAFDGVLVQARLAGTDVLGSWWQSASGPSRALERDDTVHGRVAVPTRALRAGAVRVPVGLSADLTDRIRVTLDAR